MAGRPSIGVEELSARMKDQTPLHIVQAGGAAKRRAGKRSQLAIRPYGEYRNTVGVEKAARGIHRQVIGEQTVRYRHLGNGPGGLIESERGNHRLVDCQG